ncbi:MAG: hypothetical protein ABSH34_31025 [Verrucomicrobiota bacterium]|jgi:hypothetical protein
MERREAPLSLAELRTVFRPFCEKYRIRRSVEKSPNRFARNDLLASAVCLYGS